MNPVPTSILCSSYRMSQEEKTVRSSESPLTVPSAPDREAHQASSSSPAVIANVRTLQDVERDFNKKKAQFDEAAMEYDAALSAYDAALAAWNKDPKDKALSEDLAHAKVSRDAYKFLMDGSATLLAYSRAEHALLQASRVQKSKLLCCFILYTYWTQCCTVITFLVEGTVVQTCIPRVSKVKHCPMVLLFT